MNRDSDSVLFKKYSLRECYISLTNVLNTNKISQEQRDLACLNSPDHLESSTAQAFGCSISQDYPNTTGTSTSKKSKRSRSRSSSVSVTTKRLQRSRSQDPVENFNAKESKPPGKRGRRSKYQDPFENLSSKESRHSRSSGSSASLISRRSKRSKSQDFVENLEKESGCIKSHEYQDTSGTSTPKQSRKSKCAGSSVSLAKKRGRPPKSHKSIENESIQNCLQPQSRECQVTPETAKRSRRSTSQYSPGRWATKQRPSEPQVFPENIIPKETKSQDANKNFTAKISESPNFQKLSHLNVQPHFPSENSTTKGSKCTELQDATKNSAASESECGFKDQDYARPSTSKESICADISPIKGVQSKKQNDSNRKGKQIPGKTAPNKSDQKGEKKKKRRNYRKFNCPFLRKDSFLNYLPPSANQLALQTDIDREYDEMNRYGSSSQNIELEGEERDFCFPGAWMNTMSFFGSPIIDIEGWKEK